MRFSNILFALPLAHSAIAAPLLGGLLSGLLGGGVSSPSTAGGDKADKALDIVTKLGDSITGAFNGAGGDSLDFNNIDQVSGLLTKVTEVLEDATEKLGALKNPKTKRDFDDEEAAEVNAEGLAQIVDSIEDIVTKISEDLEANDIIERLLTTIDNNLFLVLEAVEAIVPGTLDRIDKYLKTVGGILDSSLVRVQQILDGLSLLG